MLEDVSAREAMARVRAQKLRCAGCDAPSRLAVIRHRTDSTRWVASTSPDFTALLADPEWLEPQEVVFSRYRGKSYCPTCVERLNTGESTPTGERLRGADLVIFPVERTTRPSEPAGAPAADKPRRHSRRSSASSPSEPPDKSKARTKKAARAKSAPPRPSSSAANPPPKQAQTSKPKTEAPTRPPEESRQLDLF